mgnify:CR=1 FL=1
MDVFELFWCLVREATVQASAVPPVDPSGSCPFNVRDGSVRPGVEHRGADVFILEQPDHGLHQRVVIRISDSPDRGTDSLEPRCSVNVIDVY